MSPNGMASSEGLGGNVSGASSFQNYTEEDSGDWVWSKGDNSNGKKAESPKASASAGKSSRKSNKSTSAANAETSGDLLIDFGDSKSKKAASAPKARSAEEEAWDMLNS